MTHLPDLQLPTVSTIEIPATGDLVIRTVTGRLLLLDTEARAHITARHTGAGTVSGSRIDERFPLADLIGATVRASEAVGLLHVDLGVIVGTDALVSVDIIETLTRAPLSDLLARGVVRTIAGQATDPALPDFQQRAGLLEVAPDTLADTLSPADQRLLRHLVAQPTTEFNVVLAPRPSAAPTDAARAADPEIAAMRAAWAAAEQALELPSSALRTAATVITAFPGKLAPRVPADPWYRSVDVAPAEAATIAAEYEVALRFWAAHVFVNRSPVLERDRASIAELSRRPTRSR